MVGMSGTFDGGVCFGQVTWTIQAVDLADVSTGQAAGMRVQYTFADINTDVLCAYLQCYDENNTGLGFSLCQVGAATDTGITVYINRTDMLEDWNTTGKFLLTYFF